MQSFIFFYFMFTCFIPSDIKIHEEMSISLFFFYCKSVKHRKLACLSFYRKMASACRNVRILLLSGNPPNRIVKIISISEPSNDP